MYGHQQQWSAPPQAPQAPREAWDRPVRVEPVPGTPYGLAIYGTPRTVAGPAVAALVAGVAGLAVVVAVACFGLAGAEQGWGAGVAGAFTVLAGFLGGAGVWLGVVGVRRFRQGALVRDNQGAAVPGAVGGRGMAVAGLVCGAVAVLGAGCALAGVILVEAGLGLS